MIELCKVFLVWAFIIVPNCFKLNNKQTKICRKYLQKQFHQLQNVHKYRNKVL